MALSFFLLEMDPFQVFALVSSVAEPSTRNAFRFIQSISLTVTYIWPLTKSGSDRTDKTWIGSDRTHKTWIGSNSINETHIHSLKVGTFHLWIKMTKTDQESDCHCTVFAFSSPFSCETCLLIVMGLHPVNYFMKRIFF